MTLSIIVAMATDRSIGKDNDLLWRLSDDLKRFKAYTTGHSIIMGRKTFDSLPKGALPNRRNIVLSRSVKELPGAEVYPSLDEAIAAVVGEEEAFIIGGAQLYKASIDRCDKMIITHVKAEFPDADAYFPQFDSNEWDQNHVGHFDADEKNAYASELIVYTRKK